MTPISIEEAQAKLPELIDSLGAGEELVITRNELPIARLVGPAPVVGKRVFGSGRGKMVIVSEDEDHLKDFEEYMP